MSQVKLVRYYVLFIVYYIGYSNGESTTPQTPSNIKESSNALDALKDKFLAVPPLMWVIIGLILLLCFICSLFIAFCVVQQYLQHYKKEIEEAHEAHLNHWREAASASEPSAINESKTDNKPAKMMPLSRSKSHPVIHDRTFNNKAVASSPKMIAMTRSKSTAHALKYTPRAMDAKGKLGKSPRGSEKSFTHYDYEISEMSETQYTQMTQNSRNRANTLPVNRPQNDFRFHHSDPPSQQSQQYSRNSLSSHHQKHVQNKYKNAAFQRQTLQAIPSQKEPQQMMMYRNQRHPQMHPQIHPQMHPQMNAQQINRQQPLSPTASQYSAQSRNSHQSTQQMNSNSHQSAQQMKRMSTPSLRNKHPLSPTASQYSAQSNTSHQTMNAMHVTAPVNMQHVHNPQIMTVPPPPAPPQHVINITVPQQQQEEMNQNAHNINTVERKQDGTYLDASAVNDQDSPSMTDDTENTVMVLQDNVSGGIVGMMPNMFGNDDDESSTMLVDSDDDGFHD